MRVGNERGVAIITVLIITTLISALLVGVTALAIKQQQARFQDHDRTDTFYAAQAGVEKLTNDLGRLFAINYAPTDAQVQALTNAPPQINGGTSFVIPGGSGTHSGYTITRGSVSSGTVDQDPFAGLKGNITPYTLKVTAKSGATSEVSLSRVVNAVAIPVFQFGIYSETDLSFFAGPYFNFGGKVHTNGDLYLAKGSGSGSIKGDTLILADKVTVWGDVIRTHLVNGYPIAGLSGMSAYNGYTRVLTTANGCDNPDTTVSTNAACRNLATTEASVDDAGAAITGWYQAGGSFPQAISPLTIGVYNGNITNGARGASRGTGAKQLVLPITTAGSGATSYDLIRRPAIGEKSAAPSLYDQRFYSLASLRILLSDVASDITSLDDVQGSPVDLSTISNIAKADAGTAGTLMTAGEPLVTGFLSVNIQKRDGSGWTDVTSDFTTRGISGPSLAAGATCAPSTAATGPIIRLQRVRDDATRTNAAYTCTNSKAFWNNALYDPREGQRRDTNAGIATVPLAGVMYYTELDIAALRNYLASKRTTNDIMETTGYVVYFSDRRGNHKTTALPGTPPTLGTETGEYGYEDVVSATGDGNKDPGEDVNNNTLLDVYGGVVRSALPAGATTPLNAAATVDTQVSVAQARVNRPLLFRRALKLVNGNRTNMLFDATGTDPDGNTRNPLGLTVAAENPIYVQGDYNATMGDGAPASATDAIWDLPHVATSVIGDAVTLLSNGWDDRNSFTSPYTVNTNAGTPPVTTRIGTDTIYRTAIVSGKNMNFPRPTGLSADFGTDGGTHNFLRLLEAGGRTTYYRGSLVSLYYARQAVGVFKCCTTVYSAPTRQFWFDNDFTDMAKLPPRTPMFRTIDITSFSRLTEPPTP